MGKFVWVCPYCGKKFENFFAYVLHMEWHERQEREGSGRDEAVFQD